ncbi:MAG: hypothetical protein V3U75_13915 [Methylococcaceae bacterium]
MRELSQSEIEMVSGAGLGSFFKKVYKRAKKKVTKTFYKVINKGVNALGDAAVNFINRSTDRIFRRLTS